MIADKYYCLAISNISVAINDFIARTTQWVPSQELSLSRICIWNDNKFQWNDKTFLKAQHKNNPGADAVDCGKFAYVILRPT